MKVGEIIFYYSTGRSITEIYLNEPMRNGFIAAYKDAMYYDIIPYEGQGVPDYINVELKRFSTTLPLIKDSRWKRRHEVAIIPP